MAEERKIATVGEIPPGEGRTFDVGNLRVAVFHLRSGGVFATQAECPHRAGPLADGLTGGTTLVCPLHERAFDLVSGAGIGHDQHLRVYPVRVAEGGSIVIGCDAIGPKS